MSVFTTLNRPVITVMVNATSEKRAIELIRLSLKEGGADAFGIQLDRMPRSERYPNTIRNIVEACDGKPLYLTNYAGDQNEGVSDDTLCNELLSAVVDGAALIDIPADTFHHMPHQITYDPTAVNSQMQIVRKIHQHGGEVLISTHSFCFHNTEEVLRIADAHRSRGADISKIVVYANSEEEKFMIMETELALRRLYRARHLFLSAASMSQVHRLIGPLMGSCMYLVVYEKDDMAAKCQPLLKDAVQIMNMAGLI